MNIDQIKAHVERTIAGPQSRVHIHKRIEDFAESGGTTLGTDDRQNLTEFCEEYIRCVVDLLAACEIAASQTGTLKFAGPILQLSAGYFLQPRDYIPDEMGVYGLLDDAYLACRFVARISETFAAERGMPLLATGLDEISPTIRVLIGEPLATQLDRDIEETIVQVAAQIQFAQIPQWQIQQDWNSWVHRENVVNTEAQIMSIASGNF